MNSVVLIPSYKPNEVLTILCRALNERGFSVVVVNDGSGDDFNNIFNESKQYADVIGYDENKGKGYALRYGFKHIYENYKDSKSVITADGDGQHRIIDIQKVDECFTKYDCAIIGTRQFDVPIPFRSKIGNDMSKFTQALGTYRYSKDNQCGLRLFKTSDIPLLLTIKGNRYEYEMNVLSVFQMKEIKYKCVDVATIYEPENSTSHFKPLQDTIKIQASIIHKSLPSIIGNILNWVISTIFLYIVLSNVSNQFNLEVALLVGFATGFIGQSLLTFIIYKPRNVLASFLRNLMYCSITLVSNIVTSLVFTQLLGLHLLLSFLFAVIIFVFPFYYLIKYNTLMQNNLEDK